MPSDRILLEMADTHASQHRSRKALYNWLAKRYNLNPDSVRSRVSRARRKRMASSLYTLQTVTATPDVQSPSYKALQTVIEANVTKWQQGLAQLQKRGQWAKLAFWTDPHLPYQRPEAIELAAELTADFAPDILPTLSDAFDFRTLGRWENNDAVFQRLWDGDIQNAIDAHGEYMAIMRDAAPDALRPGIQGNHDDRLEAYMMRNAPDGGLFAVRHFWEAITEQGVLYMGKTPQDGIEGVRLSPGLIATHGHRANKNIETSIKNTIEDYAHDRPPSHLIFGHTHRWGVALRFGVTGYSVPCLCQLQPHYSTRPVGWQSGALLGWFDPNGRGVDLFNLRFHEVDGRLIAHWNDREYSVRLPGHMVQVAA